MIRPPLQNGGNGQRGTSKLFPLWGVLAVSLAIVVALMLSSGGKERRPGPIPPEALSRIQQEKAKAEKDFADFVQTPAGKLWQKHPYWDPAECEKIADGQIFTGMSKEQAAEAVAKVEETGTPRGEKNAEIWRADGRRNEKWVLRFEKNTLVSIENR